MRLLMAVPLAAALPLMVFRARETLLPEEIGTLPLSARSVFVLDTLAGLPIVVYAVFVVWSLVRLLRALGILAAVTIVVSAVIGAAWLWLDRRSMPAIEHYDWSKGHLVVVPGAYAVGVGLLIAWPLPTIIRWVRRPARSGGRP